MWIINNNRGKRIINMKFGKNWEIRNHHLSSSDECVSLTSSITLYDLSFMVNAMGAGGAFKEYQYKKSNVGTGLVVGALLDHPFIGLSLGLLTSSSKTEKPEFADITLIFSDGSMIDVSVNERQLCEFQKILASNLHRFSSGEVPSGGKITRGLNARELKNHIESSISIGAYTERFLRIPMMVFSLYLLVATGLYAIDMAKAIFSKGIFFSKESDSSAFDIFDFFVIRGAFGAVFTWGCMGFVVIFLIVNCMRLKGKRGNTLIAAFKDDKEESYARTVLGNEYVDEVLSKNRIKSLVLSS